MMKLWFVMAVLLLTLSSCKRGADFVLDLNAETEAFSTECVQGVAVIINKNSRTYHLDPKCRYLSRMNEENRMEITVDSEEKLLSHGYQACAGCVKITENDILP